jgi:alpha-beta hydrolase superfamily lysophospholipase
LREFQHVVTTSDGVQLSVREYLPDATPFERTLLFIHGACEHGGRYSDFAKAATVAGWRVLIPDLRGHGRSTGVKVYVRQFGEYLSDLELICRHFSFETSRTAIVGHSLGGLITARWLQVYPGQVSAACLLSPYLGLKIHVDRLTWIAGQILLWTWPWFRFKSRVRSADLSQDQEYLQERRKDELISRFVTAGWFFAVQHALGQVHEAAPQVTLPLLVLQGDQDHVTDPQATQAWFARISSSDRTLELLAGGLHELLQGKNCQPVFQRILEWLTAHCGTNSQLEAAKEPKL